MVRKRKKKHGKLSSSDAAIVRNFASSFDGGLMGLASICLYLQLRDEHAAEVADPEEDPEIRAQSLDDYVNCLADMYNDDYSEAREYAIDNLNDAMEWHNSRLPKGY